ncbi:MAG: putative lipid II flippase FtsW [bacterium]
MWRTASILIGIVLLLVALGIVMLASTSAVRGETIHHDANYFLKRQGVALIIGFIGAVFASRFDYHCWRTLAVFIGIVSVVLLVMAVTPGVGLNIKGSSRWLRMGPFNVQPSELAKFSSIILLAWWMSRIQRRADDFKVGLLVPLMLLGLLTGLIFIEPDFGTTLLMGLVGMSIMFIGGTRIGYLVIAAALGGSGFVLAIMQSPERMRRIFAFLDPDKYALDEAFQLLQAIYAFVVGGGRGAGLGASLQKQFYLPEAHTDFIFAIIGEELGIVASLGVVILFLGFLFCGLRISLRAVDSFGRLVAFGITAMITLQAAINIGVVTGCLPTKGLPLPFISFGGTSIAVSLLMVGVLVNIALQAGSEREDDDIPVIRDKGHHL